MADEAYAIAEACGAERIVRQIDEARAQIQAPGNRSERGPAEDT